MSTLALIAVGCGQTTANGPGGESAQTFDPAESPAAPSVDADVAVAIEESAVAIEESAVAIEESALDRPLPSVERYSSGSVADGVRAIAGYRSGTVVAHATTDSMAARTEPSTEAEVIDTFANPTAVGGPLVFQAVGPVQDGWIEVLLPIRPNGTTGWIPADDVSLSINPYRIEVDVTDFELTIYRYGVEELRTTVGVGVGDTPTPFGEFYLMELLRPSNPDGAYGPFAYGLSGFSDSLQSFNGGEGVIGIHGTNEPELLGQEVSHGCIRVDNDTIAAIAEFLPLGTPVSIFASD